MTMFVLNSKNPYTLQEEDIKREQFIPKCKIASVYMYRNKTANMSGKKQKFNYISMR